MPYRVCIANSFRPTPLTAASYTDAAVAVAEAKRLYALLQVKGGTLWVMDTHGVSMKPRQTHAPRQWTYKDAITPASWGAGGYSVAEWAALGTQVHDDLEEGPDVVDQGHVLVTFDDGTAAVYLDADGDGIAETPAPGDWQFRFAGEGAFDAPAGNARVFANAAPGVQAEAEDGDGELPTLGAVFPTPVNPFPAPTLRMMHTDADTGFQRLPAATDALGPLQGAEAIVIWERFHPLGFANPRGIPQASLDADAQRWQKDNAYRAAQVYVSRPQTPLLDDDGQRAGYFFKGVRGGYVYADRLLRDVHDTRDGVQVYETVLTTSDAGLQSVSPFALGAAGAGTIIKPGLRDWYVWQDAFVPAAFPAGWQVGGGAYPDFVYNANEPFPGAIHGTPWFCWQTQIWAEAVYVYRDAAGYEREITSAKITADLTLIPNWTYPTLPTLYAFAAPYVLGPGGAFGPWSGTPGELGTDGLVHQSYDSSGNLQAHERGSVYPYDFHALLCSEGDSVTGVFDDLPGAVRYHFWVSARAGAFGDSHIPSPDAPIDGDALREYLWTGDVPDHPITSTNDRPAAEAIADMGIAGQEWNSVSCSYDPVLGPFVNGGTVGAETDTIAYIMAATGETVGCGAGPGRVLVRYWQPIYQVQYVADPGSATGFKQDPNAYRPRSCGANLGSWNRQDKSATVPPHWVGPSQCGQGLILGPEPPAPEPSTAIYDGRVTYWKFTHLFSENSGTIHKPPTEPVDNAGSASFMGVGNDGENPQFQDGVGSASFMTTFNTANGDPSVRGPYIGYVRADGDLLDDASSADFQEDSGTEDEPDLVVDASPGKAVRIYHRPQRKQ